MINVSEIILLTTRTILRYVITVNAFTIVHVRYKIASRDVLLRESSITANWGH